MHSSPQYGILCLCSTLWHVISQLYAYIDSVNYDCFDHMHIIIGSWRPQKLKNTRQWSLWCICEECGPGGWNLHAHEWNTHWQREKKRQAVDEMVTEGIFNLQVTEQSFTPLDRHTHDQETPIHSALPAVSHSHSRKKIMKP
jgi:hypothetical protein